MAGRHRKPNTSPSTATVAKIALTGTVLGSSGLVVTSQASAATNSEWDQVARCESSGNWSINSGNGFKGGLQFTPATWSAYGGGQYASEAHLATKDQQIAVAERVLAHQGRGAWPVCGGPLSGAAPGNVPLDAAKSDKAPLNNSNDVASTISEAPPAAEGPEPPTPVEVLGLRVTPRAEQEAPAAALEPPAPIVVSHVAAAPPAEQEARADALEPPAPVEVSDVTAAPPAEQEAPVDAMPQPPAPVEAPIAMVEPGDSDFVPVPDDQPDTSALQAAPLPSPPSDPAPFFPVPTPDLPADIADLSAPDAVYDAAKQASLMAVISKSAGTPYISGGDSAAGTDCSGLASWMANVASGRPMFGDRFDTRTEESALLARGFQYGTAPGALVIGWNDHHTAVTLADGTPVSSGEGGGVSIGGGGAYQAQFTHHMFLPIAPGPVQSDPAPIDAPPPVEGVNL